MNLLKLLFGTKLGPREISVGDIVGRKIVKSEIKDIIKEKDEDEKNSAYNTVFGKYAFLNLLAKLADLEKEAPFKSEAQRRFLFARHPEIAREFAANTPKGTKLPEHVHHKEASKDKPDVKSVLDRARAIASKSGHPVSVVMSGGGIVFYPEGRPRSSYSKEALKKLRDETSSLAMAESSMSFLGKALGVKKSPSVLLTQHKVGSIKKQSGLFNAAAAVLPNLTMATGKSGLARVARGVGYASIPALGAIGGAMQQPRQTKITSIADRLIELTKSGLEMHSHMQASTDQAEPPDVKKKYLKTSSSPSSVKPFLGPMGQGTSGTSSGLSSLSSKGALSRGVPGTLTELAGQGAAGKQLTGRSTEERTLSAGRGPHIQRSV